MKQRKFWQQACGDTDRNYASICLKWGVILNGPGDFGAWPECELLLLEEGVSSRKVTDLRRFAEDMTDGDVVVLRLGTKDVLAVGVIVGEYEYGMGGVVTRMKPFSSAGHCFQQRWPALDLY